VPARGGCEANPGGGASLPQLGKMTGQGWLAGR